MHCLRAKKLIAPLMKIRGELSITAAILVLCHNFTYGITYFKMLFIKPEALSATQLTASNNKPCAYHNNDCAYSNFISGCKKEDAG